MRRGIAPSPVSTVVEILCWRALHQPDRVAYRFLSDGEEDDRLSYAQLSQRARKIAAALQHCAAPGDRALLLYPPGLDFVSAFWGCLSAGVIAVPAYPPRNPRHMPRLQAIASDSGAVVALTDARSISKLHAWLAACGGLESLRLLVTDELPDDEPSVPREPSYSRDMPAFLQYTSGSTASPKGVVVSHGNLLHNSAYIAEGFEHTPESSSVTWLPMFHDMGLIDGVVQPVYSGFPCSFMAPTAFLQQPFRWLQAISRYRATHSGGPNFAYDLCVQRVTPEQRRELDLSSWAVAYNGAEPIRPSTLKRFVEAYESCGVRWHALYPCYGLAEATLKATGGRKHEPPFVCTVDADALEHNRVAQSPDESKRLQPLVGCGRASGGMTLAIVNPASLTRCRPDEVGEIWLSGESVTQGYWNRPEETEHTFRARIADTGEGPFLRTGDLGFIREGELFVTGRIKDLIVIRGLNHYPQDIELTVQQSHPALRAGGGAAFSVEVNEQERLVIVQEVDQRQRVELNRLMSDIRQRVAEVHELEVYRIVLVKSGAVPKTSSGKVQRRLCRTMFLAAGLSVVAEWQSAGSAEGRALAVAAAGSQVTADAVRARMASWLTGKCMVAPADINFEAPCARYGLDSLATMELVHELEGSFGVRLAAGDFFGDQNLSQIAERVVAQSTAQAARAEIAPVASVREEIEYPLSQGQEALWFLRHLKPESAAYNVVRAMRVCAEVDAACLRDAFQRLVERHACLRTSFVTAHGSVTQRIQKGQQVSFVWQDVSTWSDEALRRHLTEEAQRPFDLEHGPVFKVRLYTRAKNDHVVLLAVDHIISDFWSLAVLMHELGTLYEAQRKGFDARLPPLTLQFGDYVRWQEELLASAEGERLRSYWESQMTGDLPVLNLPTDRPRPRTLSDDGDSESFTLDEDLVTTLKKFAEAHGVTLYVLLLAAFQVLLHRYTGQDEVIVASPVNGRTLKELVGPVGYFVNLLPLRGRVNERSTFAEVVEQMRATVSGALAHQNYPFSALVRESQTTRTLDRSPLAEVMFVLQQTPFADQKELAAFALEQSEAEVRLGELELQLMPLPQKFTQFDLSLTMAEVGGRLAASLNYRTELFEAETIGRLGRHYEVLLRSALADPLRPIWRLELMEERERRLLLGGWNRACERGAGAVCVQELFEREAAARAEAEAVESGGERVSYGELNARANRLAHYLRRRGVGPEVRVGLCVERSPDMLVAILGILKAGGAYIPLDPQYPQSRLSFMLKDGQARMLLTKQRLAAQLNPPDDIEVVFLDREQADIERENEQNPRGDVCADNLAYVIYTSGSTGRPKGVAITHRNAFSLLRWAAGQFSEEELARVLASTSICFDLSVFELFAPLTRGGAAVVVRDALELAEASEQVTLINTVPSVMTELLRLKAVPATTHTVNLAGEPLTRALVEQVYAEPQVERVLNLYGPTEYTTYATCASMGRSPEVVTVGRPVSNTRVYILGRAFEPVPVGVTGEIYIGGEGLARGYINRPGLTAQSFLPDPFGASPGARLYRTGDLARFMPDGEIEYLGRIDHQVKIRGYRIELGEVEFVLTQHPSVKEAVVVSRDDSAGPRLVGYVVAAQGPVGSAELREYLRQRLPEYMIPSAFVALERLPLTANGKLNRAALPEPERTEERPAQVAPRTELELVLANIWAEALKRQSIGVTEDFFELGGHSLLATRIVARIWDELQVTLSVRQLFESPTVEKLAQVVSQCKVEREQARKPGKERISERDSDELLAELDYFSDAEIDALYAELTAEESEIE
jgi:amino acid adenylation domain-containing protein